MLLLQAFIHGIILTHTHTSECMHSLPLLLWLLQFCGYLPVNVSTPSQWRQFPRMEIVWESLHRNGYTFAFCGVFNLPLTQIGSEYIYTHILTHTMHTKVCVACSLFIWNQDVSGVWSRKKYPGCRAFTIVYMKDDLSASLNLILHILSTIMSNSFKYLIELGPSYWALLVSCTNFVGG